MMDINRHGSEENDGIDKISSLPDDVCTHILYFLTTKEAVQTCILSNTWIKTWASVLDLKFDIEEFGLLTLEIFFDEIDVEELLTKFELLVKSVLEKRETTCVNRFQLWLDSKVYWPCTQAVADCIGDAMKLEPRECSVKLCTFEFLKTDLIFTCASLIYLQLFLSIEVNHFKAIEPNSVNLPCLKTLDLGGVTMSDDSLKKLLLGCHVLEELVLENCYLGYIIKICSDTLKKLELASSHEIMKLHISAPNLLYLDITVFLHINVRDMGEIMLLNMPSLVDASIVLPGWYDQDKYITMGPKLFHNLSNFESLQLELGCPNGNVLSLCKIFEAKICNDFTLHILFVGLIKILGLIVF